MKTFKLSKIITAECEGYQTRYSWGHKAYLYVKGKGTDYAKITYYNRTWEAYEYESILEKIIGNTKLLTKRQKTYAFKKIRDYQKVEHERVNKIFGTIGRIAQMGELLCNTKEEKNDWKERMLRAGLENKGLIMPDDWNTLSEDEKEKRLNGVISILK